MLALININALGVLVLVSPVILYGYRYSHICDSHSYSVDT